MKCDAKAFSKLYEQVYQDLYRYALCLMRDPHEAYSRQKIFSRKDRWKEFMKKMWDLRWM